MKRLYSTLLDRIIGNHFSVFSDHHWGKKSCKIWLLPPLVNTCLQVGQRVSINLHLVCFWLLELRIWLRLPFLYFLFFFCFFFLFSFSLICARSERLLVCIDRPCLRLPWGLQSKAYLGIWIGPYAPCGRSIFTFDVLAAGMLCELYVCFVTFS